MNEIEKKKIPFIADHGEVSIGRVGYLEDGTILPSSLNREVIFLDEKRWAVGGYDRTTLRELLVNWVHAYDGYHDYHQLTQALRDFEVKYPSKVVLESAGNSVEGRKLWYVRLTDGNLNHKSRPKFFYHANMHGDEVVGRELMLYLIGYLLSQFGKDDRVTALLSHAEIFIMPSMNPDGFELRTRANAHGKDLNRNFPDRFKSPLDTPAGREPEVAHMMELAQKHHFIYGINWHGGEICFNLPWGNIKNTPANLHGDDSFFHPIGREYTKQNGPMYLNHKDNFDHGLTYGYEWYPVNGGINDWFNFFRRSLHAVVELSVTKWPQSSTLQKFWNENREAMIQFLWQGLRGIHLKIRTENGEDIKNVTVEITSLQNRPITFDSGDIHRVTGAGNQEVRLSVSGFMPKTLFLPAVFYDGNPISVILSSLRNK